MDTFTWFITLVGGIGLGFFVCYYFIVKKDKDWIQALEERDVVYQVNLYLLRNGIDLKLERRTTNKNEVIFRFDKLQFKSLDMAITFIKGYTKESNETLIIDESWLTIINKTD